MCKLLFIVVILSTLGCASQKKEILIDRQEILYDSTKVSDRSFRVTIITTLKYKSNRTFAKEDLEEFYMLADEDTLDLKIKGIRQFTNNSSTKVEYITFLKHREKEYSDTSFVSRIENWQIKNKDTKITLKKSSDYKIVSLIALWENNNSNKIQ